MLIGVAPADVDRYKSASFRKFLPHIARARGLPNQARNEIGLWADSDGQKAADHAARKRQRGSGTSFAMPDRYSADAGRDLTTTLMQQQIDAAAAVCKVGHESLPLHGGWDLLLRATGGAARAGGSSSARLASTNADVCAMCNAGGNLLMCDECTSSWHLAQKMRSGGNSVPVMLIRKDSFDPGFEGSAAGGPQ